MKEDIKRHSEWSDFEATEVLSSRNIEIWTELWFHIKGMGGHTNDCEWYWGL
jgi:hypothetical protein